MLALIGSPTLAERHKPLSPSRVVGRLIVVEFPEGHFQQTAAPYEHARLIGHAA